MLHAHLIYLGGFRMVLEDSKSRNELRELLFNAQDTGALSEGEAGFVLSLAKRFKSDIEKKEKQAYQMMGEINQLKINLNIIMEMVGNLIAAEERAKARIETAKKLREDKPTKKKK